MLKYRLGSLKDRLLSFGADGGKYQLPGKGHVSLPSVILLTAISASLSCRAERTFERPPITASDNFDPSVADTGA